MKQYRALLPSLFQLFALLCLHLPGFYMGQYMQKCPEGWLHSGPDWPCSAFVGGGFAGLSAAGMALSLLLLFRRLRAGRSRLAPAVSGVCVLLLLGAELGRSLKKLPAGSFGPTAAGPSSTGPSFSSCSAGSLRRRMA